MMTTMTTNKKGVVECIYCGEVFGANFDRLEDETSVEVEINEYVDFCSPECREEWLSDFFPEWVTDAGN